MRVLALTLVLLVLLLGQSPATLDMRSEIATIDLPIELVVTPPRAQRVDLDRIKAEQEAAAAAEEAAKPKGLHGLPFAPAGLSNCDEMNFYRVQAGLPYRFSDQPRTGAKGFGWRESNCRNEDSVHTSCCYGYWQLHKAHFAPGNVFDSECGVTSYLDVNSDTPIDKQRQACAAYRLYLRDGLSPWQ